MHLDAVRFRYATVKSSARVASGLGWPSAVPWKASARNQRRPECHEYN